MGLIKEKLTGWIQKATTTATETVKEITKEDVNKTLDVLGDIAKIGIFAALTVGAFKTSATPHKVVETVRASEVLQPVAHVAQATSPVVQIFVGEGKGVHIE